MIKQKYILHVISLYLRRRSIFIVFIVGYPLKTSKKMALNFFPRSPQRVFKYYLAEIWMKY